MSRTGSVAHDPSDRARRGHLPGSSREERFEFLAPNPSPPGEAGEVCGDGGVMGRTEVVELHRGVSTSLAPDRDMRAGVPPSVGDGLEPDSVGPVAPIWSRE